MKERITKRRSIHVVSGVLLLTIVLPFLLFAVPGLAGADASLVVLSGSMSPEIEPGDVVFVEETPPESVKEGDVVTFHTEVPEEYYGEDPDTNLVTHRVVNVEEDDNQRVFTTQGDALDQPDPQPVVGEQIVGTVAFTIPYLGRVIAFAGSQTGLMLFVIVPCALLVLNEVYELVVATTGKE